MFVYSVVLQCLYNHWQPEAFSVFFVLHVWHCSQDAQHSSVVLQPLVQICDREM